MDKIQYIRSKDIDKKSWDNTIIKADNTRIYARSWYLDATSPGWDCIVYGNYEYVMPVTISTKFGFKLIIQPSYAQQLGIFPAASNNIADLFLKELRKKSKYITIGLNASNSFKTNDFECFDRINYILNLNRDFETISKSFKQNTKRQIKKSTHQTDIKPVDIEDYLQIKKAYAGDFVTNKKLALLRLILIESKARNLMEINGAFDNENNMVAAGIFLNDNFRITYLNGVSTPDGKKTGGMFALVSDQIKRNANSNKLMDFEGSSIPGVARFFKGFGAETETYRVIKKNTSLILKLLNY